MAWKEILVMALTTYAIRVSPFLLFKHKIENRFVQSFLFYVPFVVLSAMTFPAIFTSTQSVPASLIGTSVALVLAYFEKSLLVVALGAALAAFLGGIL